MAPPAGTSTMLRSRRRDATLKPNRTLDRNASRGMLYENEELRLRTININAEVEKGQNYIKKLRRENEQLKKEIWNLREEYDRLENYVKSREQSENEEDDCCSGGEIMLVEEPGSSGDTVVTTLETVVEEEDGGNESIVGGNDAEPAVDQNSIIQCVVDRGESDGDRDAAVADGGQRDRVVAEVVCSITSGGGGGGGDNDRKGRVAVTEDEPTAVIGCGADDTCSDHAADDDRPEWLGVATDPVEGRDETDQLQREPAAAVHQDATMTLPHTACFDTGNNRQLHDLTVDEVIVAVQDADLRDKLRSVCVTEDRCYMTFATAEYLERALHSIFRIRDVPVLLIDTGAGAVILSLTGVPEAVTDKEVLKCLKKYGTIVGGVERKTGRSGATSGERYVRVRPTLGVPRYLWFGSDKVIVRQLTEHETGTMNSVARRKSFRSQIKLNLKMIDPSTCTPSPSGRSGGGGGESSYDRANGGGGKTPYDRANGASGDGNGGAVATDDVRAVSDNAVSVKNGFRFPTVDPKTGPVPHNLAPEPHCKSVAVAAALPTSASVKLPGSPKRTVKVLQNDRDGCPQTPIPAESPLRGRRRPSLVQGVFRRDTMTKHRGGSLSRAEDADSDTSTICRRKLSITGHERVEKVPWCGCWGNGCL